MRRIHHDLSSVRSAAEKRTRLKPVEAACLGDLSLGAEVAGQVVHNDAAVPAKNARTCSMKRRADHALRESTKHAAACTHRRRKPSTPRDRSEKSTQGCSWWTEQRRKREDWSRPRCGCRSIRSWSSVQSHRVRCAAPNCCRKDAGGLIGRHGQLEVVRLGRVGADNLDVEDGVVAVAAEMCVGCAGQR